MATAASKASSLTTLVIGKVEIPVGLFTTVAKPGKVQEFTTAGPNGGALKAQMRARPTPVTEVRDEDPDVPVHSDPLADEPAMTINRMGPTRNLMTGETVPDDHPCAQEMQSMAQSIADSATFEPWSEEHATAAEAIAAGDPVAIDAAAEMEARPLERVHMLSRVDSLNAARVDGEYARVLVEEGSGVEVPPEQVRRGVRLDDGSFVDCTEQLAAIEERTRLERMEVLAFVDITQVPRARVAGTYYVGAGDETAPVPLRLLFEGLKAKRRGAVVKLTKRSRQSLGVIGWLGQSLVLYEMVFSENFRTPPPRATSVARATVSVAQVAMVCDLIDAMSAPVGVLDAQRDDAIALREELRAQALAGEVEQVTAPAKPDEPEDLMASLEASLAQVRS